MRGVTRKEVGIATEFRNGSNIEFDGMGELQSAAEGVEGHEGVEQGLEEETLGRRMEARAIDGRCVVVEVAQNVSAVGGEIYIKGGVGAKAAMRRGWSGCGWMAESRGGIRGEDLAGDCAGGDGLGGFIPRSAVECRWVSIRGGIDETDKAFGSVDAEFTDGGHHGRLVEVVLDMGDEDAKI